MTAKDIAKRVIDALPQDASMDDILHPLHVRARFDNGEQEIRSSQGVAQNLAKHRLRKWVR